MTEGGNGPKEEEREGIKCRARGELFRKPNDVLFSALVCNKVFL